MQTIFSLEELKKILKINNFPFNEEKRNKEWANSCLILKNAFEDFAPEFFKKNEFGKPYLTNRKENISISHSYDKIALNINYESESCGIDIEKMDVKILKIEKKFISERDFTSFDSPKHQHLIWGAKEVLFKIHSIGQLNYNNHLEIKQIEKNILLGEIIKPQFEKKFKIEFTEIDNFILVWNIE